jgi:predicted DNA-binding transcriptional regulator YafY
VVPAGALRWGTEKRLELIDLRLFWDGVVNRQQLAAAFGISLQQASADFARYLEIAPGNAAYNRAAKGYVRSKTFIPRLTTPDAARHLAQLRLAAEGIADTGLLRPADAPSFDIVPGPTRRIDPLVLREILDSIRRRSEIKIIYQSISRPEPEARWIAPHSLAFDGFRWHTRAGCARDGIFKDFVLARISHAGGTRPTVFDPAADDGWHRHVRVILGPHPRLSQGQKKAVEADYGMTGGVSVTDVRASFLWYFLKRFGLERDDAAKSPQDQHITLLNREDVMSALSSTQEA